MALSGLIALLVLLGCGRQMFAGQLTLDLSALGTWESESNNGVVEVSNQGEQLETGSQSNDIPGDDLQFEWLNYYVLDLTSLADSAPISSVTFQWPSFLAYENEPGNYNLWSTTDSPSTVEGSGTDVSIFENLEGVTSYGSAPAISSTTPGYLAYNLDGDSEFIDFLNANLGNLVVIGGGSPVARPEMAGTDVIFTVTTVPEPTAIVLFLSAAAGFMFSIRCNVLNRRLNKSAT